VLLYIERWLKAGVEQADGSVASRQKGTPQGGAISPLLANLYLHHVFDMWMRRNFPSNPFERYADDIIVHCSSKEEAEHLLVSISERLRGFELELNAEKTKLVYCKNDRRKEKHEHESFTFLSYSFQPRQDQVCITVYNKLQYLQQQSVVRPKPLSGNGSGRFSTPEISTPRCKKLHISSIPKYGDGLTITVNLMEGKPKRYLNISMS
jgi:hypothetical protein